MSNLQAFIDSCFGGPARKIEDADIPELTRTPELREQLARVAEAARLLDEIEVVRERCRAALQWQLAEFNRLNLAEIARREGVSFDA